MNCEGHKAPPLSRDEWWILFGLVGDGEGLKTAKKELYSRDRITVTRAYNVACELHRRGINILSDEEARNTADKAKYGTSTKYVQDASLKYLSWHDSRKSKEFLEEKFRELVCSCLTNPHTEICTEYDWKPLHVEGYDYRLDPVTWFHLCTPDFSEDRYWKPYLPELKRYLENMGFWEHYMSLQANVWKLQKHYERVAEKLERDNKEFLSTWAEIQKHRTMESRPSRIPADLEPDLNRYKPCYDTAYCDRIIKTFEGNIDGLFSRLCDLEEQLQQLNYDLSCP